MASVLIPLAPGFEELEAITIVDLLRRAEIEVITAGLADGPVRASRGCVLVPDVVLDEVIQRDFDMVVLPGGQPGTNNLNADERILSILRRHQRQDKYIAAICAAPKVLANAGLLEGRHATSFPGALDGIEVAGMTYETRPVVNDGKVITSRGPGTALDFALELIELLCDRDTRNRVEAALQRP